MKALRNNQRRASTSVAFTIIEMMLAIGIFMMILISIYSVWSGIVKASQAAKKAAEMAQRGRVAMSAIESALLTAQMFTANMPPQNPTAYYSFDASMNNGEYGTLSFVAHLPANFPGVGQFGDNVVRRVTFTCETAKDGTINLVMLQGPMLEAMNPDYDFYKIVLARDVQTFGFEMFGQPDPIKKPQQKPEWHEDWVTTNSLPMMMRVGLGLGKTKGGDAKDLVVKLITLPATAVQPGWQGGAPPP